MNYKKLRKKLYGKFKIVKIYQGKELILNMFKQDYRVQKINQENKLFKFNQIREMSGAKFA